MSEDFLHQPHDKIVKRTFGQVGTAAALFQAYLPKRLTRHLDLARAELVPGTFIDEHLRGRDSDLLYQIPCRGKEVLVYVLLEHLAKEDPASALRLLSYMTRIWEQWQREHPGERGLPVIVPVVLAQQPGGWRQEPTFGALFDLTPEERADFEGVIPDFRFELIELAKLAYEQIVGTPMGIMTLRVLKAQPLQALLSEAVWDEPLLAQLSPEDRRTILRYILALGEVDREGMARKVEQLRGEELRRDTMTLAEQFIQQGREEGMEQGMEQGIERGIERGVARGREEGALIGRIQLLQSLLGRLETPADELAKQSSGELRALHDELRQALG